MNLLSKMAQHNGLNIHFLDSFNDADPSLTPIVICPGLSETAGEYVDLLQFLLPRRGVVLSFRGRGKSDTPQEGYDLEHHVSDIEAIVKEAGVEYFHLFAYSRGVPYALEYANQHTPLIASMIMQDYPPEHKAMSTEWADDYINNYLIPVGREMNIRQETVRGIQRESTQKSISVNFDRPVLVAKGLLKGSLLTDNDLERYKKQFPHLHLHEFTKSGHDIRRTEKAALYSAINDFLS
ncbi:alpha/beta fold hydrolase [Paenibacillus arenosi]|uniref:Alpha/beta hydrolase n=1 Tax=Paenibacillus arenosi TaxID=2774142 RepID=A0ABR9AYN0_9BACL|nr:alpha/beta hydrolase [Paenibacillus arenosi]MBD8499247.1 alpha/beta hydrolase [Paenibacillus arenosi]